MFGSRAVREQVVTWVDRAIDVQDGVLRAHVDGVRTGSRGTGADGIAAALEGQYLATVAGSGAVVGGAASVPGLGTGVAVGLSVAETAAFLDATALFTLAVAEARGHRVDGLAHRRALLLLALLGDDAVALAGRGADGTADGWGLRLAALPPDAVEGVNRTAERWLLTRFGTRQTVFVLGRLAPFGIGAAVGAAGNAVTARGVIARVRSAFTTAPGTPAVSAGPAVAEPAVAEPAVAEPAVAEPAVTEPAVTEPAVAVQPVTEPAVAVQPVTEPAAAVQPVTEQSDAGDLEDAATGTGTVPPAGKYLGLYRLLAARPGDAVSMSLDDVAASVAGGLPAAARRSPAWWSNEPAPRAGQARAWLAAGLQVSEVDLPGGVVHLRRGAAPAGPGPELTAVQG